jgi:pilus assembly protein TadC
MILLGALCACLATFAAIDAIHGESAIKRRLALLAPPASTTRRSRIVDDRDLRQAELFRGRSHLVVVKCVALVCGASFGALVGGGSGTALPAAIVLAYACWVAPSLAVERRAKGRRRDAETAVGPFLERLEALVAAGRPVETAIGALARVPSASQLLDAALRRAADAYVLGAPLFRALSAAADHEGIGSLGSIAAALERSRDLGRGSVAVIRDARDAARAAERAASLEVASQVEGKLMLTLVLCYLPALMLLVVIPLFLTLLDGLFG